MNRVVIAFLGAMVPALALSAAPIQFDIKDPKGVNNVVFKTDAVLESINGTANGISGTVMFDPEDPGATAGKIILAANTLHVGNPMMKQHLHSEMWMDVAKFPEITFQLVNLKNLKMDGNVTTASALGKLTIKGVTREMEAPVKLTFLKGKLKQRSGKEGDLLVVRSNFTVKRSDFGINAGNGEDRVSNEIELSLSVAGSAPR